MQAGSFIAAFVVLLALLISSAVVAGLRGADIGAVSDILFRRNAEAGLIATALSWVWLVLGLASIAAAFVAFATLEGDENPNRLPHRRMPKIAPALILALSLAALWFVFGPRQTPGPAERAPAPQPEQTIPDLDAALAGADAPSPAATETAPAAAPEPPETPEPPEPPPPEPPPAQLPQPAPPGAPERAATVAEETSFFWTYEYPLMRNGTALGSREVERALAELLPMRDPDGAVARLLCGKVWVAFTGSASEEGPPDRNAMRARARATLIARRAAAWLDAHPECDRPVILALDLGQHAPTAASDPAETAYQRQAIIVSRARTEPGERIDPAAAEAELAAFYADPAMRSRLLGARRYRAAPGIFRPEGT